MKYDIAIVGGGIMGSSIAHHLTRDGRAGTVCVIEPDATYEWAATTRGAGGVRQLFSLPENVEMSKYSLAFYRDFAESMAVDGAPAPIDFRQQGYLFVVDKPGVAQLEENFRLQSGLGVRAELLDRGALAARFPSLDADDVAMAVHSPEDGWIDPHGAVQGLRRKAISQGAVYIADRVTGLETAGGKVAAAGLASGGTVTAEVFVNAAGAWAPALAAGIGMDLPVEPLPRHQHYFTAQAELEPLPLVKDESGVFFRPEGAGYVCGRPRWDVAAGFNFTDDHGYFERAVWPALARRVPAFEAIRLQRTWTGHYAQNRLDGNMILGAWTGGADNFYVATGFSGHGIMHAPAVGLAMAELILDGGFSTIDVSRLSYQRVIDGIPYREKGIV